MVSNITVATAPCSWGVWYADGKPSGTPWRIFLDGAAKAGYKALELGPDGYLPRDNSELDSELAARGMSVCAGTACIQFDRFVQSNQGGNFNDLAASVEALCARVSALGARYLVVMDESDVGEYSEKKASFDKNTWTVYLSVIKELAAWTRERFNLETVFHPHIRSLVETEEEIIRMLDFCGLRLCFDTGHHAYVNGGCEHGDTSALCFIKQYASQIAYLHFKNVDEVIRKKVRDEGLSSSTAFQLDVMCDLEKGIIDFTQLKQVLDEIQFEGIGVVEMDMPNASPETAFGAAKRNLEYLQRIRMIP